MAPIHVLSDDVLLEIFDFCVGQDGSRRFIFTKINREAWQTLVHVCKRWRNIVFGSPLRLNLALVCTAKTPTRNTLDVWPPLPLVIRSSGYYATSSDFPKESMDNIVAVLERRDRVCEISLMGVPGSHLETLLAAVHKPFPKLTHIRLNSYGGPVIPESFLGGSAPRLQYISLNGIPFPGLPKLLMSATHLVYLQILKIPHSGYIPPDTMATTLSTLTSLEYLSLKFQSPQSFPDQESQRPHPLTRSVLPVLADFTFKGVSEYLEYFMARVDAPQLSGLHITFFNQIIFDTPQFIQFVNRTPTFKALQKADVIFGDDTARVRLSLVSSLTSRYKGLYVKIPCRELDWQVSSLQQVCISSLLPLSTLEVLYIHKDPSSQPEWQDNIENAMWLELLHQFPAVKNLHLCEEFAPRIVPALQELVGSRATEVLPNLQNIFLEELQSSGPVREGIQHFVATRQVTGHPIAVFRWDDPERDKYSNIL